MKFEDYSPPASPSLAQQRDALRKGLGRAKQWALTDKLADEVLLEACLKDQRYDRSIDDIRGDWLWSMVQAADAGERFRTPILHALLQFTDDGNATQLCQLALRYALAGDVSFRNAIREIVERKPFPDTPWLGEEEFLSLDGEEGFLFAAKRRGELLASRDWEWDDGNLAKSACNRFGEERILGLLNASNDPALLRFRDGWLIDQAKPESTPSKRPHEGKTSMDVLIAAERPDKCYWFRAWGKDANEEELRIVLDRLRVEKDTKVLANLLIVFAARRMPEFEPCLLDLCQYDEQEIRWRAFAATRQLSHPLVRKFAETGFRDGISSGNMASLFVLNYQTGDEDRILDALALPTDEDELHSLLMEVSRVLEENAEADCERLGIIGYALNPCGVCRSKSAYLLRDCEIMPGWMAKECKHDADEDCRKLMNASKEPESL